MSGRGWDPEYYSTGVRIGFYKNFGNGVLESYADETSVQPDANGRFSFESTIPAGFATGDIVTFSGLIGNGGGERANFTVSGGGQSGSGGSTAKPDLAPTAIQYDQQKAQVNSNIYFDSGIVNNGGADTAVFNIKWFVDGKEVGAYGSHAGIPAGTRVLDGNSQFEFAFPQPGTYEVQFRVDADDFIDESDEANNSTSVEVTVGFVCIRGPNGGCNEVEDPKGRTAAPTWNEYLDYLDSVYQSGSNVEPGVSCVKEASRPTDPVNILDCLGVLAQQNPLAEVAIDLAGCKIATLVPGAAAPELIEACVGPALTAAHGVIESVKAEARRNPALAEFLERPMF